MDWIFTNWEKAVPILISSVSVLISAIAVAVAIYNSIKTQKQLRASKKPALSMRLDKFERALFLTIENTGVVPAKDISVIETAVKDNGHETKTGIQVSLVENLELYPNETSQVEFGFCGEDITTGRLSPTLVIDVSYRYDGQKRKVAYSRSVTLSRHWDKRVLADVNMDLSSLEDSLDATARATLRTANYLDGTQLFVFDKINKVSTRNFHNDICHALKTQEEIDIFAFAKKHDAEHDSEKEEE